MTNNMRASLALVLALVSITSTWANRCDGFPCPAGQVCELHETRCRELRCPIAPTCVDNPCNRVDCPPHKPSCELREVQCFAAPCNRQPTCVSAAPGNIEHRGVCPASSGNVGICVFIPGHNCLSDNECAADEKCCSAGCGKVCKKARTGINTNVCLGVSCPPGLYCRENPASGQAQCFDPCRQANCRPDQTCRIQTVQCIRAPCPPMGVCVDRPGPTVDPRCAAITCPVGKECRAETSPCLFPPCPTHVGCFDPRPTLPENPCASTLCASNTQCRLQVCRPNTSDRCPLRSVCKPRSTSLNPCRVMSPILSATSGREIFCGRGPSREECPRGTTCNIHPLDHYAVCCLNSGSNPPPPPPPTQDPCQAVRCRPDQRCEVPVFNCFRSPCPQPRPVCVDIQPTLDPRCAALTCPTGHECQIKTMPCIFPPCPTHAVCVDPRPTFPENPCTTVRCGATTECRLQICRPFTSDRCPISATCKPKSNAENPCPVGKPLLSVSGSEIFCGAGPSSHLCPRGSTCKIHPADRYAVCCLNSPLNPPPGPSPRPGTCPVPSGFGICVEECFSDASCPGTLKCCSNGCGHVCMRPESTRPTQPEKPGRCGRVSAYFCTRQRSCREDWDCPGPMKCCNSRGCGKVCTRPRRHGPRPNPNPNTNPFPFPYHPHYPNANRG